MSDLNNMHVNVFYIMGHVCEINNITDIILIIAVIYLFYTRVIKMGDFSTLHFISSMAKLTTLTSEEMVYPSTNITDDTSFQCNRLHPVIFSPLNAIEHELTLEVIESI